MGDIELDMDGIDIKPTQAMTQLSTSMRAQDTLKGCELEGTTLSTWQKFIRVAVSSVLPAGDYQKTVVDKDQVDGHFTVVAAGGKRVSYDGGVEYEIDNYIKHYNCRPPPLFIPIITAIEILVFIGHAVADGGVTAMEGGAPLQSPLIFNPARRYEAWRFLTYMLLHQGYLHIVFNLFVQLLLGIPLEMVHKAHRVGIVYILGVIAGSTVHAVVDRFTLLAGASGGVYSLIGAHLAVIIMNWKEMTHDWMEGPGKFLCSAPFRLTVWLILVVTDTAIAVYQRYFTDEETTVGYAAHFGGALAGVVVGITVMKNIKCRYWENVLWYVALVAYLTLMIFVVLWNCFYPDYPTTDWRDCCPDPIITRHRVE